MSGDTRTSIADLKTLDTFWYFFSEYHPIMEFKSLVWKRVKKMTFLGFEIGSGVGEPGGTPHQEFPEVPTPLLDLEPAS